MLHIPQIPNITGTSASDCLMSYPGHSLGRGVTPLQRSSRCILLTQPTGPIKIDLLTGILVYNDFMLKLIRGFFSMFIWFILLSKLAEFLMCKWLIVPKRVDDILAKDFAMLWKAAPIPEIIIIMSCRQHGYPWPSLATSPYHLSPPAGLQGYILCPHIVAVCKFVLVVLLLHIHMWGSTGVHRLWARPCFSSSVPRVWFV